MDKAGRKDSRRGRPDLHWCPLQGPAHGAALPARPSDLPHLSGLPSAACRPVRGRLRAPASASGFGGWEEREGCRDPETGDGAGGSGGGPRGEAGGLCAAAGAIGLPQPKWPGHRHPHRPPSLARWGSVGPGELKGPNLGREWGCAGQGRRGSAPRRAGWQLALSAGDCAGSLEAEG